MKLSSMHQLLMVMATALAAFFCVRSLYLTANGGGFPQLALGAVGALVTTLLVIYLRRFRARLADTSAMRRPSSNSGG
ncbi:MAG TPA: hypothetical protein ENK23_04520 [Sorangium sp.]|nr:hypothetical protein [Sorangium sp.]